MTNPSKSKFHNLPGNPSQTRWRSAAGWRPWRPAPARALRVTNPKCFGYRTRAPAAHRSANPGQWSVPRCQKYAAARLSSFLLLRSSPETVRGGSACSYASDVELSAPVAGRRAVQPSTPNPASHVWLLGTPNPDPNLIRKPQRAPLPGRTGAGCLETTPPPRKTRRARPPARTPTPSSRALGSPHRRWCTACCTASPRARWRTRTAGCPPPRTPSAGSARRARRAPSPAAPSRTQLSAPYSRGAVCTCTAAEVLMCMSSSHPASAIGTEQSCLCMQIHA